ncbi:MAG TPA: biotin/lipoyl-containing protein [Chthonomonadaceae bacterium]|nr:biotin/lipoyl-containing protein [Chthonomonadaceae bacterium]
MEIAELEQLVQLVRASNAGELTLRHEGARVTIRKSPAHSQDVEVETAPAEYEYTAEMTSMVDDSAADRETTMLVTAPLVGVFAHVKPLIGLNAHVAEGQVIGAIEAMKLITEIRSPANGTIVDMFIEASHPVEYGQALFEIRPD